MNEESKSKEEMILATSPYVLGIDLGTSNSSASIYTKGEIITIKIDNDNLSIPSVVRFPNRKLEGVTEGRTAKKYILSEPDTVFSSVKTLMRNDDWEEDIDLKNKYTIEDKALTPTYMAAQILSKIFEDVHENFDTQGEIQNAVICVPANTTDEYRLNVYEAAEIAGLGLKDKDGEIIKDKEGKPMGISLLEEPKAAAIAYAFETGFFEGEKEQTILVYDLGGGTFDVTILHVDSTNSEAVPNIKVKQTKGLAKLGGDDFDRLIMEMCARQFLEDTDIDIFDTKREQGGGIKPKDLKNAQQRIKEEAEKVKIEFAGGINKSEIEIPSLLTDGNGDTHNLHVELNKKEFVEKLSPLLDSAIDCVMDALRDAELTLDDLNRIILVGGSTKADWIKNSIQEKLGREPYMAKNVDVVVARGAAFFGVNRPVSDEDLKAGAKGGGKGVTIEGIVSHHLGIEMKGGIFGLVLEQGLPLNTETPVQSASRFFGNPDQQDSVQITIWKTQKSMNFEEDESGKRVVKEKHSINERNQRGQPLFECIGEFTLSGIPKAPEGSISIKVAMEINEENLLKVSAFLPDGGAAVDTEINVVKS